ncbi:MAG: hypothetical protein WAZ50_03330 [Minisyncoccia bacterium]
MPRNIEDIIVPEKNDRKSIRNIPIPEGRVRNERKIPINIHPSKSEMNDRKIEKNADEDSSFIFKPKKRSPKKVIIISSVVGLLLVIFALLSIFKSATLTYDPKIFNLTFNKDSYTAYKTGGEKDLMFSVIKLSGTKGVEAKASGEEKVSIKANGKAVVYNNTDTVVKLIRNTRFQAVDGKIFRILADISVPAKKGTTPGSLEVNLYADVAGVEYNIGLTDFTVPGLKGDPKYSKVYARSKTAMTGGFVGVRKQVSDTDLAKAKATLEVTLKSELMLQAKAQVPADFILYPNLIVINYSDLPQTSPKADSVTLNEQADFYGVMFKRSDLNNYLAQKKASQGIIVSVEIVDLASLDATLQKQSTQDFIKAEQISFELSGNARAVAIVPVENLKKDLVGSNKSDLASSLIKYPSIDNANVKIHPFWKNSFPTNVNDIKIIKNPLK